MPVIPSLALNFALMNGRAVTNIMVFEGLSVANRD